MSRAGASASTLAAQTPVTARDPLEIRPRVT
jgi:hypothetical protein